MIPKNQHHALLLRVARLLYGSSWQTGLAAALKINTRTVQRWATGERLPGAKTWAKLAGLTRQRHADLAAILDEIALAERPPVGSE